MLSGMIEGSLDPDAARFPEDGGTSLVRGFGLRERCREGSHPISRMAATSARFRACYARTGNSDTWLNNDHRY